MFKKVFIKVFKSDRKTFTQKDVVEFIENKDNAEEAAFGSMLKRLDTLDKASKVK